MNKRHHVSYNFIVHVSFCDMILYFIVYEQEIMNFSVLIFGEVVVKITV